MDKYEIVNMVRSDLLLVLLTFTLLQGPSQATTIMDRSVDAREVEAAKDVHYAGFENFMTKFGKSYDSIGEKLLRFDIFKQNLKRIETLNAQEQGTATYGVTRFADLSQEEFKDKYLVMGSFPSELEEDFSENQTPKSVAEMRESSEIFQNLLKGNDTCSFDWRKGNKFYPPAEDQAQCGSCYSFGSIGVFDILYSKKYSKITYFSKQQLMDCSGKGCGGGNMLYSYEYMTKTGLFEKKDYPYLAQNQSCMFKQKLQHKAKLYKLLKYARVGDEAEIAKVLPESPVVVATDGAAMQLYEKGIMNPTAEACSHTLIDHFVVVIGMGCVTPPGKNALPFWTIRNSWGDYWGEEGHFRMVMGHHACGIGTHYNVRGWV